ncbi:MAG: hypothetical protein OEY49_19745 [Candidatus Heimdallarchaeota archaeon]|nr:hypothetical protein [Candidatus Heimdallarchaeota archaeon]
MKYGFVFPREHGLIAFWLASLYLSLFTFITLGKIVPVDQRPIRFSYFILAIIYSIIVIFSYGSIKNLVKSKFKKIEKIPIIILILFTIILLVLKPINELYWIFITIGLLSIIWGFLCIQTKKVNYNEIGVGILILSLHYPIIMVFTLGDIDNFPIQQIMAIWWIFTGIANATSIRVGSLRGRISHHQPLIRTFLFLISTIPLFSLNITHPIFILLMIEPIYQNILQWKRKPSIKESKLSIRKIGLNLILSLSASLILFSICIHQQFK